MSKDNIVTVQVTKRNGKLIYRNKAMETLHREFINNLEENQTVEIFFEALNDDGTYMQLSKIHPCIRKLANEMGHTFEDMKKVIKERAGLTVGDITDGGHIKSFADCSAEELSGVIQTIIEAGDFVGINFRGKLPEKNP
jgi:hypothetical protein